MTLHYFHEVKVFCTRADIKGHFMSYITRTEQNTGQQVEMIHTDNAKELMAIR